MSYIMYHSMSGNRTGGREWRQAGVLGGMALVAMLVGALALARPVEAQLSCPDKNAQCLIDKINEANRKGQGTIIYLGKGPYTLTGAPITHADRTWNALPSITGSVTIVGSGAASTSRLAWWRSRIAQSTIIGPALAAGLPTTERRSSSGTVRSAATMPPRGGLAKPTREASSMPLARRG